VSVMTEVSLSSRGAAVAELLHRYPSLVRWRMSLGAVVAVIGIVWWREPAVQSEDAALWLVRACAVVMVMGAVFLLDDASMNLTEASVIPQRVRAGLRVGLMAIVVGLGCLPAAVVAASRFPVGSHWLGLVVELTAITVVTAAVALTLQRRRGIPEPGQFASVGAVVVVFCAQLMGSRWPMLVAPGPDWSDAHRRWLALLAVGVLTLLWRLRDPAAGRRVKHE